MPDRQRQWQGYRKKNQKDPASTKTVSSGYITCTPMRTTSETIQFQERQTGCEVYAPDKERCFTRHSIFEQAFLYGGTPPDDLKHKFLSAQESKVIPLNARRFAKGYEADSRYFRNMVCFHTEDDYRITAGLGGRPLLKGTG